jgi:hypothetical protein
MSKLVVALKTKRHESYLLCFDDPSPKCAIFQLQYEVILQMQSGCACVGSAYLLGFL